MLKQTEIETIANDSTVVTQEKGPGSAVDLPVLRSEEDTLREVLDTAHGPLGTWRLILICGMMALAFMNIVVLVLGSAIALPEISVDFDESPAQVQWVMSALMLTWGCFMLVAGRISDILGRKKTFLAGTTFFLLGNLLSSFMPNLIGLATMQGVAGVGAAIMVPGGLGIIGAQVPVGRPQGYAFAAFSAGAPLGAGLRGIIAGAVITAGLGWRTFYRIMAGMAAVPTILGIVLVPMDHGVTNNRRIDWFSAALITLSLFLILFGFSTSQTSAQRWRTPYIGPCLAVGILLCAFFVWWQHHQSKKPEDQRPPIMLPLRLFKRGRGNLAVIYLAALFIWFCTDPFHIICSYYFQRYLHNTALEAGYKYSAAPVAGVLACILVGILQNRVPAKIILCCAAAMTSIGTILMATNNPSWGYWKVEWLAMALSAFATDTTVSVATAIVGDVVALDEQGVAQALLATFMRFGAAMGLSISSVIMGSFERHEADRLRSMARLEPDAALSPPDADRAVLVGLRAAFWSSGISVTLGFLIYLFGLRYVGIAGRRAASKV